MNQQETNQIAAIFAMYAAYYRYKLDDIVLKMYAKDLSDLNFSDVENALDKYRRDPKNKTLPMPSQIRDLITPVASLEAQGRAIANKIYQAILDHGYSNPSDARRSIGEIGWQIVGEYGGWVNLCENHGGKIQTATFTAQARERAIDLVKQQTASNVIQIGHKSKDRDLV